MDTKSTVRDQVLDHAITLMMLRGFNGFSYKDLSQLIGVKTSSIHYYFPAKDDLVLEAVGHYSKEVLAAVYAIDTILTAKAQLRKYTSLFGRTLGDGDQICLCGMLAADIASLPTPVRVAVQAFFEANERWLAQLLVRGTVDGTVTSPGKSEASAKTLYAAYQGSLLASRLFQTKSRLSDVEATWLAIR